MNTYWPTPAMNFFVFMLYFVFPFNFGLFICDSFKRALLYGSIAGVGGLVISALLWRFLHWNF
jgi:hypothetical protein